MPENAENTEVKDDQEPSEESLEETEAENPSEETAGTEDETAEAQAENGAEEEDPEIPAPQNANPVPEIPPEEPFVPLEWIWKAWMVHLLFYLFFAFGVVKAPVSHVDRRNIYFLFAGATLWVFTAGVNCFLAESPVRRLMAIAVAMVNSFLIPLTIQVTWGSPQLTFFAGAWFIIITVIVSPIDVGVCTYAAGFCFVFFKATVLPGESGDLEFVKYITIYILAGFLAVAWKIFIGKMWQVLRFTTTVKEEQGNGPGEDAENASRLASELSKVAREEKLLKHAIAMQIVKIRKLNDHLTSKKGDAS